MSKPDLDFIDGLMAHANIDTETAELLALGYAIGLESSSSSYHGKLFRGKTKEERLTSILDRNDLGEKLGLEISKKVSPKH